MDPAGPPRPATIWRVVAAAAAALTVACVGFAVHSDLTTPLVQEFGSSSAGAAIPGLALALPGALLMWRLGPHPIALVLAGFGVLWGLDGVAVGLVSQALASGADSGLAVWGFWYYVRFGASLLLPFQLVLLLFPDGRLRPGGWRWVSVASLALGLVMPLTFLLAPAEALAAGDPARIASLERFDLRLPTLPLPDAAWAGLVATAFPAEVLAMVLAFAVIVSRRRGASPELIAQLRWLTWSGLLFVALVVASQWLPTIVSDIAFALGIAAVSGSILVAVTAHGLYAIDRLLSWTIIYALLLLGVVVIDLGLYLLVGSLFDDRTTMLLALLAVVVAYTPLRDQLHRLVSRWVNGNRDDPYEVVSRLADRLEHAGGPQQQLGELAEVIATAFASGFVRVELDRSSGTSLSAQTGPDEPASVTLPLQYEGRDIGRILMQPGRRPAISRRDRRLLSDIVRLSAVALRNAELSRELQLIRENLVTAREEERARLRRELHDGLGPLFGGIRLRLEATRNLAARDPRRSLQVLDSAIEESGEVLDEIRRLVHDLRPPALDDLGLVRALEQQAVRVGAGSLDVLVTAEPLPPLAAAVEVAAYRIASEALTNAVRHAGASQARVRLRHETDVLVLEIEDDGAGIAEDRTPGVGLISMRERATELGGRVDFLPARPGTLVRATLPSRPRNDEETDHG